MDVVNAVATLAEKVVMVMASSLEAGGLAWQVDGCDDTLFGQKTQIAVNRCQIEIGNFLLCERQQFLRQQRTSGLLDHLPNRAALTGSSSHAEMVNDGRASCNCECICIKMRICRLVAPPQSSCPHQREHVFSSCLSCRFGGPCGRSRLVSTDMSHPLIDIRDLSIRYGHTLALSHLSLRIQHGEMLAICGPNGAGKSTLLRCLAGLIRPSEGEIRGLSGIRVSYLPQAHQLDRTFPITVMELVSMGLWHETGALRGLSRTQQDKCLSVLGSVGLRAQHGDPISSLSGGQFQRVLFARTVLQDADVVLLDEPFQGVDSRAAAGLMDQILGMQRTGKVIVAVLHDHHLGLGHFPRIVLLSGQLIASGIPADALSATNIERAYRGSSQVDQRASELRSHGDIAAIQPLRACA